MKKSLYLLIVLGFMMTAGRVDAQFRSIPSVVTDSFKVKYPTAANVSWSDKVSNFQASFMMGKDRLVAKYDSKGVWQQTWQKISKDELPGAVKDGLSKSKYAGADWAIKSVTMYHNPGNVTQYGMLVQKSSLEKKNLLFSSDGQLLKDSSTL